MKLIKNEDIEAITSFMREELDGKEDKAWNKNIPDSNLKRPWVDEIANLDQVPEDKLSALQEILLEYKPHLQKEDENISRMSLGDMISLIGRKNPKSKIPMGISTLEKNEEAKRKELNRIKEIGKQDFNQIMSTTNKKVLKTMSLNLDVSYENLKELRGEYSRQIKIYKKEINERANAVMKPRRVSRIRQVSMPKDSYLEPYGRGFESLVLSRFAPSRASVRNFVHNLTQNKGKSSAILNFLLDSESNEHGQINEIFPESRGFNELSDSEKRSVINFVHQTFVKLSESDEGYGKKSIIIKNMIKKEFAGKESKTTKDLSSSLTIRILVKLQAECENSGLLSTYHDKKNLTVYQRILLNTHIALANKLIRKQMITSLDDLVFIDTSNTLLDYHQQTDFLFMITKGEYAGATFSFDLTRNPAKNKLNKEKRTRRSKASNKLNAVAGTVLTLYKEEEEGDMFTSDDIGFAIDKAVRNLNGYIGKLMNGNFVHYSFDPSLAVFYNNIITKKRQQTKSEIA